MLRRVNHNLLSGVIAMQELELAVFDHGDVAREKLAKLLLRFESDKKVHVNLEVIPWRGAWSQMVSYALYKHGPDVAEVGSTWVSDLYRMDALRPYTSQDISSFGGKEHFLENCWRVETTADDSFTPETIWSVPWTADTRAIFYRRDLLHAAGIEETTAFKDAIEFEKTLVKLHACGFESPLVIPTVRSRLTIHNIASWIWGSGGDFANKDFSEVAFVKPEAMKGITQYFRLGRFLPKTQKSIEEAEVNDRFVAGKAAVTIGGHWLMWDQRFPPEVRENIGLAVVPGTPFLGGEHLVIWKHSFHPELAAQLIRYLVNSEYGLSLFPDVGLPASLSGLTRPPFTTDPHYQIFAESLRRGRVLPVTPLWGMVENRLTDTFPLIWQAVLEEEAPDVEAILREYLLPVARRLNITLQG